MRLCLSSAGRGAILLAAAWSGIVLAADWPQFRGPGRDGISEETGLLREWPEAGPPLLWRLDGIGRGYSSPIVADGRVVVTGDTPEALSITALDRDTGTRLWTVSNGKPWLGPYPGARASVTAAAGRLYHLNAHGRLCCLDPEDGRERWSVDILERFGGRPIQWGLSECVLVDGNRVIVTPGGDTALLAALDAASGETVWSGPPLRFRRTMAMGGKPVEPPVEDVDRAGYASPILFELGGRRLLAAASARHFVVADAQDGTLLWTLEIPTPFEVIGAIPLWCAAGLLFVAPDVGARLYAVTASGEGIRVAERWRHPLDNCHGALVYVDGFLYGAGYRLHRPWSALRADSGTLAYEFADLAKGSILHADGRLYAFSERGVLALLEPTASGFVDRGRIRVAERAGGDIWSHPAIADGRLYVRWRESLFCYDIRAPRPESQ